MNTDNEYFAYGHYGYYKKRILETMFDIQDRLKVYLALKSKGELTPDDLKRIYDLPYELQLAIITLLPKVDIVKKDNPYVADIGNISENNNMDLINDPKLFLLYYQKYVTLIEALGYSDMNTKRATSNPYGKVDFKEDYRAV